MDQRDLSPKQRKAFQKWEDLCKRINNGIEPVNDESEFKKRQRIQRLLKPENFEEFCQHYFPNYCTAPFGWFHKKAANNVLVKKSRKHFWEWHRESAKSVFGDIFMPAHMLFSGKLDGMILAGQTEKKACKLIGDLQAELMNNRRIIQDFGDFDIRGSWMNGYYETKDGIGFWAFGIGQDPAGTRNGSRRPNLGIADDCDSKSVAKNQKRVEERVDWLLGEFMGCLQTNDSTFIYNNNRVVKDGINAHLLGDFEEGDERDPSWDHIKVYITENPETHEAIKPEYSTDVEAVLQSLIDLGAVPAWKENFSLRKCAEKIVDMKKRNAWRQLYHDDIKEGTVFTDDTLPWVKCLALHEYDALVTYVDPAYGESKKGCYRALGLIGKKGHNYDVIWAWIRQNADFAKAQYKLATRIADSPHTIIKGAARFTATPACEHWVESNELQKQLLKRIYQELNRSIPVPFRPRFDMDKKSDKISRIESLETIAEDKQLRFNIDEKNDADMIRLRDQFKDFPNGYLDGPDMVEGGVSKLNKKVKRSKTGRRAGNYKRNTAR